MSGEEDPVDSGDSAGADPGNAGPTPPPPTSPTSTTSTTSAVPTRAPRQRGRALAVAAAALALLALALAAAVAALAWALHHPAGSAWLLDRVPGLHVEAPSGSLIGDFSATQIVYEIGSAGELRLVAPRWRGLAVVRGDHGRWLHLVIDSLQVGRAVWIAKPSTAPARALALPASLRLPIEIEIHAAHIDELRIGSTEATPIRDLQARVHLGADSGARHRFDDASARVEQVDARGAFAIGSDAPFPVEATLDANAAAQGLSASVRARGPLEALATNATARVVASTSHPAQALDIDAVIHPLAPWPLGELHASASALDLSAFAAVLPATSLSGRAVATTSGMNLPASVSIDLSNARAGRWNEGLLPVRSLRAELRARPDDPRTIDVQSVVAELGSAAAAAGRIAGSGRWQDGRWTIDAELKAVRPTLLDARAADAVIGGTVALVGTGFGAGSAAGSVAASGAASAPASAANAPADEARVDITAALTGELTDRRLPRAATKPARLGLEAAVSARAIELRRAEATLGEASATLAGRLSRAAANDPWHAAGRLALTRFDPAPWWPGAPEALLGRGANRLDAHGDFDLALPRNESGGTVYALLAATTGSAHLVLLDSVLAGVPLAGSASFVNPDGQARPVVDLVAAGNKVHVEGTIARREARNDDWRVAVDAPRLDGLAPLLAASGARARGSHAASPAIAGALALHGHIAGRWPDVTSDGDLQGRGLHLPSLDVRTASGRWRVGSRDDAVVEGTLALDGIDAGGRAIERLEGHLAGTARAHRLELRMTSALLPPAWTDALVPRASAASSASAPSSASSASARSNASVPSSTPASSSTSSVASAASGAPSAAARSVVSLVAEGGLVDAGGARAGGWRGTVRELLARSTGTPTRTWLSARDVHGSVLWAGAPLRVELDPGRAEVLGAAVRWGRVAWQEGSAAAAARLDAHAEVEPIAVAPILQALQPGFGWGGDLRVGARLDVRSSAGVVVDMVIERSAGDLTVTDEISTQPLGLTDLRLAIAAENGVWHFTAATAGRTLGVASAALTARTDAHATWPGADAPIEGVSELRVDNLGTWGAWLTPGWRLGGQLHASASFGGRFGAPQYTGHVEGSGVSVRNFLEGVDVTEGEIAIALRGTSAHVERFTAKGGAGTLRVEGDASFDSAPTARLRVVLERFALLARVDRRIVASGSAAMRLDAKTLALDGSFKVDQGLIDFTRSDAPTLGSDVEVVRRPGDVRTTAGAPGAPGAADTSTTPLTPPVAPPRDVQLDLRVDMGEHLRVRGRGLDAGLRGELQITSPGGRLTVNGTLRTVDGTYQAYGQKLGIDRGVLTFVGLVENPRLDIEATRPNLDVRVGVTVTGTALYPRIRLFSEPDMADIDKLSWLVLGRASDTTGGADTALLQQAALALLSGEGPGVTDRIIKSFGLDEVSVRQQQAQGTTTKDTIVSLGKQISKRWYVGYERGLNTTLGTWQLIYRVAQRITVRAEAGSDNAIDVNWTWRWK